MGKRLFARKALPDGSGSIPLALPAPRNPCRVRADWA